MTARSQFERFIALVHHIAPKFTESVARDTLYYDDRMIEGHYIPALLLRRLRAKNVANLIITVPSQLSCTSEKSFVKELTLLFKAVSESPPNYAMLAITVMFIGYPDHKGPTDNLTWILRQQAAHTANALKCINGCEGIELSRRPQLIICPQSSDPSNHRTFKCVSCEPFDFVNDGIGNIFALTGIQLQNQSCTRAVK